MFGDVLNLALATKAQCLMTQVIKCLCHVLHTTNQPTNPPTATTQLAGPLPLIRSH